MQYHFNSQLHRLDLSNDRLLQMYYLLYYDLPKEDQESAENLCLLIETREKIKLELRRHLFSLKNSSTESTMLNAVMGFLPTFKKLEALTRSTFNNPKLKLCYEKECQNLKLYYETLYNQNIPSTTIDHFLKHEKQKKLVKKLVPTR